METLKFEITIQQIETALTAAFPKVLADSYDSPIRKCVEAAVKEKEGAIKKVVDEIITEAITNPAFKTRIADVVLAQMVNAAIKK